MLHVPADLIHRLKHHGQDHVLYGWDRLSTEERNSLVYQLAGLDLGELDQLYARKDEPHAVLPTPDRIAPLPVEPRDAIPRASAESGEDAIRRGEVAVLLVAGGQGSRLGSDRPKGMFPVGPVSGATLFRVHAEKVLALRRRYGTAVPFLIMTSPATDADTRREFEANGYYGLPPDDVFFFQQLMMPALDRESGRLLLERPGQLFLSPNGHGGTLIALADSGLLADLAARGVRYVFYFQVDNPLVQIADPAFIGRHIETGSDVSSKVVFKERPEEKVGILALIDGRKGILEYSDLPADLAAELDADGNLKYRAGSPAIHIFSVPFLERVTSGSTRLAYHIAKKKVPYFDTATGQLVTPQSENALKFELFVFDALPLAERWLAVQVRREDEFAPLKNATGPDSPETVRKLLVGRAARWLAAAGVAVSTHPDGEPVFPLEVSPLFALDEFECAAKIPPGFAVTGPTVLE